MDADFLLKIEQAALNAWPAPRQMLYDGWLLRFAGGPSKRVNSVTPFYPSLLPLAEKIRTCEWIYTTQGQPCLFRISDLAENEKLKHGIKAAGYTPFDPTLVLGHSLVMDAERHPNVTLLEMPMEDWFRMRAHFIRVSAADQQVHGAILNNIVPEKVLMGLFYEGQPVACGMGVVEGSLLGFFSIYTDARWRRKGYAGMIMAALTEWGIDRGATYGYLQVEGDNVPALALYDRLGFESCYQYTYYMKE
jgi:N-acetylglutamate synthase